MRRLAALLLLLVFAGHAAEAQIDPRPVLYVWSAESPPSGLSWCGRCNLFWGDVKNEETGLRAALEKHVKIQYVNFERNRANAVLAGVEFLPTFILGGRKVVGYTTPEDLCLRLGIAPPVKGWAPQASPPAGGVQPQTFDAPALSPATEQLLNGINSRLQAIEQSKDSTQQQLHALESLGAELAKAVEQMSADRIADRAAADAMLERIDAMLALQEQRQAAPETAPPQAETIEAEGETPHKSWLEWLLTFGGAVGIIPGTLATGGAGGVALAAGSWALRRWIQRRRESRSTAAAPSTPPRPATLDDETRRVVERIRELEFRLRTKGGEAEAASPRSDPATPEQRIIPPRETTELNQLLRLARLEGHDPLLDAAFGLFASDEFERAAGDEQLSGEVKSVLSDILRRIRDRIDQAAPLSIKGE